MTSFVASEDVKHGCVINQHLGFLSEDLLELVKPTYLAHHV